jgi:hypothetical protein
VYLSPVAGRRLITCDSYQAQCCAVGEHRPQANTAYLHRRVGRSHTGRGSEAMAPLGRDGITLASERFFAGYEPFLSDTAFRLSTVRVDIFIAGLVRIRNVFLGIDFLARQFHGQCRQSSSGSRAGDHQPHAC